MKWSEIKARLPEFVIPLHDKAWVLAEIKKGIEEMNDYDMTEPDDVECFESDMAFESDGSIILGKPNTVEFAGLMEIGFQFGLQTNDMWLDDTSSLEYITQRLWKELSELSILDLRSMESYVSILGEYAETVKPFSDITGAKLKKELNLFVTELIAQSLLGTDNLDMKSTEDCKKFIKEKYSAKVKRVKKEKWCNIEYRIFEDEDGEQYTIVSYKDKLISHYPFSYEMDY